MWWLSVTVPRGAVVAFDLEGECPAGWRRHDNSAGRFIVGAITNPPDEDPKIGFDSRAGRYSHPTEVVMAADRESGVSVPADPDNMPPYIALQFCTPGN